MKLKFSKADSTLLGVIMGIVLTGILLVGCVNSIASNSLNSKYSDNSEKIVVFNDIIGSFEDDSINDIQTHYLVSTTKDLFLFFSKGSDKITLKYNGAKDKQNGDFIFARPTDAACEDSACICYSSNALFWNTLKETPFISPTDLYPSFKDDIEEWHGYLKCVRASNPDAIFSNSRGLDLDFNKAKVNILPLEIPVFLQGEYAKGDYGSTVQSLFDDNADLNFARRVKLKEDYVWDGGVAIGGMGSPITKDDLKNRELKIPPYNIYFQKVKDSNLIGVCLQETCLYSKGIKELKSFSETIKEQNLVVSKFDSFLLYTTNDFITCTDLVDYSSCVNSLQKELEYFFDGIDKKYTIELSKYSMVATKIILLDTGVSTSEGLIPISMPKLGNTPKDSLIIAGAENGKVDVDLGKYSFKGSKLNGLFYLDLV